MEDLSNYTTAELKAELKRRAEIARARRAELKAELQMNL